MTDLPALRGTYLPAPISEIGEFATIASRSGMFGTSKPEELIVKLMAGASWGVPPMAAMTDVYVVKGKPMASGTLLRSMIRASGRYDYRVTEQTDEAAEIEFLRVLPSGDREHLGTQRFSMADAKRAGYTSNALYGKAPRNMLLARATSDGVKAHCPDVFMGSIYVEGEIEEDRPQPRHVEASAPRPNPPQAPRHVEAELVDDRPQRDAKPETPRADRERPQRQPETLSEDGGPPMALRPTTDAIYRLAGALDPEERDEVGAALWGCRTEAQAEAIRAQVQGRLVELEDEQAALAARAAETVARTAATAPRAKPDPSAKWRQREREATGDDHAAAAGEVADLDVNDVLGDEHAEVGA